MSKAMWEILVPTVKRKSGKPIRTRFHKIWDSKVREITHGLTILSPAKGYWKTADGVLFEERMIPVRIVATKEEIDKVINITIDYYDQLAVLCYKISDEVILKYRNGKTGE